MTDEIMEPLMTDIEKAHAYQELRHRCANMGYSRVGFALVALGKKMGHISMTTPPDYDEMLARSEAAQAAAYDDLREQAAYLGHACIGYALDELEQYEEAA